MADVIAIKIASTWLYLAYMIPTLFSSYSLILFDPSYSSYTVEIIFHLDLYGGTVMPHDIVIDLRQNGWI